MLRLLNLAAIAAMVLAAAWVYAIKFDAAIEAESVSTLRAEIRRERDAIAALRAEWARLDRPDRIQELAGRHLKLKPVETAQFDALDNLPERPTPLVPPGTTDPIAAVIETLGDAEVVTGTLPRRGGR